MKILHIDTEKTWRGGENQTRLLIEGLQKKGVEAFLVAQPGSEIANRLSSLVPTITISMRGGADFIAAWKIARFCRESRVDVIDCQTGNAHSIGLIAKAFYPRIRLVVHRRVDYPPKSSFFSQLKYFSKRVDRYVAISGKIYELLKDYGLERSRLRCIPSAVDSAIYKSIDKVKARADLISRFKLSEEMVLLGNASALTDQKGYEILVAAVALLAQENLDFHCFIAGDGPLRQSLEAQAKQLQVEHKITFLGWIKGVPEFLSALDILAMPSHFEGLGTVIQDALYAGCCVVATEVGGIPEMIMHQKTGLLSPKANHQRFANNLKLAIESEQLRDDLNSAGRIHLKENFGLDSMVEENFKVYSELLASPAQS